MELIERVLHLLLPSAFDQDDLQSWMHMQIVRIEEQVRPLLVQYQNPVEELMEVRGKKTFDLFFQFVDLIASRTSMYEMLTVPQKPRSGNTSDIASVHRDATERECMAVLWAVGRFRPFVAGRKFTHVTGCLAISQQRLDP